MSAEPSPLGVALLGHRFMGRAHSSAYARVGSFFDVPRAPVRRVVAGRSAGELEAFARRWGWERHVTDWREVAGDPEVELVDVATPNDAHAEPSVAMLEAGKHVACEKPLAGTLDDARAMRDAASRFEGRTFVWFNYRRAPAVGLARALVREGRIGRVYHVRATYLQSWGGPETPLLWRFRRASAGSGAHGDLNAHLVDLARFLTGDEIAEVRGALAPTFVEERELPDGGGRGRSDVDDAALFLATTRGGAVASFEASRVAAPHQNGCAIELNGEHGSLRWEFEDMNTLLFHDAADGPREGGWRRISATHAGVHPYVDAWWPPGHLLGYEHGFVNMLADVCRVLGGEEPELPLPDFADAYETQRVLEAAMRSAAERRQVPLDEVE